MRSNYHAVVTWGYIAILAIILWVCAAPTIWRIVFLIISAAGVAVPVYLTREGLARWKPDPSEL